MPKQPVDAARLARFRRLAGEDMWVRDLPGWRLVGLNTEIMGTGLAEEAAQAGFIAAAAAGVGDRCLAVFLHTPAFTTAPEDPAFDYWSVAPEARAALRPLLDHPGLRLVASGHLHLHHEFTPRRGALCLGAAGLLPVRARDAARPAGGAPARRAAAPARRGCGGDHPGVAGRHAASLAGGLCAPRPIRARPRSLAHDPAPIRVLSTLGVLGVVRRPAAGGARRPASSRRSASTPPPGWSRRSRRGSGPTSPSSPPRGSRRRPRPVCWTARAGSTCAGPRSASRCGPARRIPTSRRRRPSARRCWQRRRWPIPAPGRAASSSPG